MPVPKTGSLVNGEAFLSAFGEPVKLISDEGKVIQGIFKPYNALDEVGSYQTARRYSYRLWLPRGLTEADKLAFQQELEIGDKVEVRETTFLLPALRKTPTTGTYLPL